MKNTNHETNYCAHAIDDFSSALSGELSADTRETLTELCRGLKESLHFRLPDSGVIFELKQGEKITDVIRDYCPQFRLPFPVTALEFTIDGESQKSDRYDASIILLREILNREGERAILMRPLVRASHASRKTWIPEDYAAVINVETLTIEALWQTEEGKAGSSDAAPMLAGPLTVLAGFVAALSCSNAATANAPAPNPALNAKRRKAGKTPFFSYKVLTLDLEATTRARGAKVGGHASPRVHLRRGHIRRLVGRTVWVNAAVVGDKRKGFIHKDYELT